VANIIRYSSGSYEIVPIDYLFAKVLKIFIGSESLAIVLQASNQ
jgi:hypothetical protein